VTTYGQTLAEHDADRAAFLAAVGERTLRAVLAANARAAADPALPADRRAQAERIAARVADELARRRAAADA